MNRPLYQTEADTNHETEIVSLLQRFLSCDGIHKMPISYGLDYALLSSGRVQYFAEIKDRPGLSFQYGDGYYIALQKVLKARAITEACLVSCVLVVRFSDQQVRLTTFAAREPRIILHGRTDRGDPADIEPCCVYPWSKFIPVTP